MLFGDMMFYFYDVLFQALETSKSHVNVNDFDFIRVIGRGSYAKVIYVSNLSILIYLKCGLCNRERYFTMNSF